MSTSLPEGLVEAQASSWPILVGLVVITISLGATLAREGRQGRNQGREAKTKSLSKIRGYRRNRERNPPRLGLWWVF